jgi:hypothetical protein
MQKVAHALGYALVLVFEYTAYVYKLISWTLLFWLSLPADSLELTPCDGELESKYQFNLKDSLARSSQSRLLAGMHFFVSDNVRPPPDEMKRIIEANGGTCSTSSGIFISVTMPCGCIGGGFLSGPPEGTSQDSFIIARDAQDIKPAWRNLDVPVLFVRISTSLSSVCIMTI